MKKSISILMCFTLTACMVNNCAFYSSAEDKPTEIVSLRNAYEKHFQNSDGSITALVYSSPIHYYENGMWNEYDNRLIKTESGSYSTSKGPMQVTLAPSYASIPSKNNLMVNIAHKDYSLGICAVDTTRQIHTEQFSTLSIDSTADKVSIDSDNDELAAIVSDYMSKANSSVTYDSVYGDTDLNISIQPSTVYESIEIQSQESALSDYSFFIYAPGLVATVDEVENVYFSNSDEEVIFTIPCPVIYDSSSACSTAVDIEFTQTNDGCAYSIIPDAEWIADEDRVYPITVSTQATISEYRNIDTCYNSEADPYSIKRDIYLKIGGETGNRFQSYIAFADSFTSYPSNAVIQDAKFNFYCLPEGSSDDGVNIHVYSNNTEPMNVSWDTASSLTNYNTHISTNAAHSSAGYTCSNVDITELVQSWLNYSQTSQTTVGVPNYGFKLITTMSNTVVTYSSTSLYYKPYYEITYVNQASHVIEYNPHKYNDIIDNSNGSIYNFQKRMNCYAYALQTYYRGTLSSNTNYSLKPGEFGISHQDDSYEYDISTYSDLTDYYNGFSANMHQLVEIDKTTASDILNPVFASYMDFVEEQMFKDAATLNYSITRIGDTNTLTFPSDYNESQERVIALVVYYSSLSDVMDYHFYLRHKNGTCSNDNHSETCSLWSHKRGATPTSTYMNINGSNFTLCDNTTYCMTMFDNGYRTYSEIRYYLITKDTDLSNSWHGNGAYSSSTGTPYCP